MPDPDAVDSCCLHCGLPSVRVAVRKVTKDDPVTRGTMEGPLIFFSCPDCGDYCTTATVYGITQTPAMLAFDFPESIRRARADGRGKPSWPIDSDCLIKRGRL